MLLITKTKVKPPVVKNIKEIAQQVYSCADIDLVYGVELEIENLNPVRHPDDYLVQHMSRHEDNSLRNNGWEFVTSPMRLRELEYTLATFFEKADLSEANYSERCSTHVHCNTTDMTLDQIQCLLAVYLVYESLLFQWIGNERDRNIFCVPLKETTLTMAMIQEGDLEAWQNKWNNWEKYTALNLKPLFTQGTIEFRHMAGTCDLKTIILWCNLIGRMFAYAKRTPFKEALAALTSLNSSSKYIEITQNIFGTEAPILTTNPDFTVFLEEGVLNLKYGLQKEPVVQKQKSGFMFAADGRPEAIARAEQDLRAVLQRDLELAEERAVRAFRDREQRLRANINRDGRLQAARNPFMNPPPVNPGPLVQQRVDGVFGDPVWQPLPQGVNDGDAQFFRAINQIPAPVNLADFAIPNNEENV